MMRDCRLVTRSSTTTSAGRAAQARSEAPETASHSSWVKKPGRTRNPFSSQNLRRFSPRTELMRLLTPGGEQLPSASMVPGEGGATGRGSTDQLEIAPEAQVDRLRRRTAALERQLET